VEETAGTNALQPDTDSDGYFDGAEVEFGGAPLDGGKLPEWKTHIRPSATPEPGVVIRFPTLPGKSYSVHASTDLIEWQELRWLTGTGGVMSHSEPRGSHTSRFFKVEAIDAPPEFALIPARSFTMGDSIDGDPWGDASPVTVQVSAFFMGKYEVTKTLWDEVRTWGASNGYTDLSTGMGKASNHPVQTISWWDIVKWCNARSQKEGLTPVYTVSGSVMKTGTTAPTVNWSASGYRLPTEAEWEKAARGGLSGKRFPWGDEISHSQANYIALSDYSYDLSGSVYNYHPTYATGNEPYTSPVGVLAENDYGLHDMAGNVWEWCWDWYGSYSNEPIDPRGANSGGLRVLRGGSWYDPADYCRVAFRGYFNPSNPYYFIGFRVARSSGSQ
jgi:formylglycine-generating enzyme required for sulfatase activity